MMNLYKIFYCSLFIILSLLRSGNRFIIFNHLSLNALLLFFYATLLLLSVCFGPLHYPYLIFVVE